MAYKTWDERAADAIEDEFESGEMTPAEYREAMRGLRDEVRDDIESAARERALEYGIGRD